MSSNPVDDRIVALWDARGIIQTKWAWVNEPEGIEMLARIAARLDWQWFQHLKYLHETDYRFKWGHPW